MESLVPADVAGRRSRPKYVDASEPPRAHRQQTPPWWCLDSCYRHRVSKRTDLGRREGSDCQSGMVLVIIIGVMRAVMHVVSQASVTEEKQRISEMTGPGLMILLGVHVDDTQKQAVALVNKILEL